MAQASDGVDQEDPAAQGGSGVLRRDEQRGRRLHEEAPGDHGRRGRGAQAGPGTLQVGPRV